MAEREGFEPSVRFWRTHTFQACSFDRSDTSPEMQCPASAGRARESLYQGRGDRNAMIPYRQDSAEELGKTLPAFLVAHRRIADVEPDDQCDHRRTNPYHGDPTL